MRGLVLALFIAWALLCTFIVGCMVAYADDGDTYGNPGRLEGRLVSVVRETNPERSDVVSAYHAREDCPKLAEARTDERVEITKVMMVNRRLIDPNGDTYEAYRCHACVGSRLR